MTETRVSTVITRIEIAGAATKEEKVPLPSKMKTAIMTLTSIVSVVMDTASLTTSVNFAILEIKMRGVKAFTDMVEEKEQWPSQAFPAIMISKIIASVPKAISNAVKVVKRIVTNAIMMHGAKVWEDLDPMAEKILEIAGTTFVSIVPASTVTS